MRNNSQTVAFIAPFVLRYFDCKVRDGAQKVDQYDKKDVVLMAVWHTRCDKPRDDIIIWLPWRNEGAIVHLKGDAGANAFLRNRYTALDVEYDFKLAHE